MITVNDRFRFKRNPRCWILYETRQTFSHKTKKHHTKVDKSYYTSLIDLCGAIIDRSAGDAADGMENIIQCVKRAKIDIFVAMQGGKLTK